MNVMLNKLKKEIKETTAHNESNKSSDNEIAKLRRILLVESEIRIIE